MMQWYSQQVANHPTVVILIVFCLSAIGIVISLTTRDLPDFKDPLLGFEPRGTSLAQRSTAWNILLDSTSRSGILSMYPTFETPDLTECKNASSYLMPKTYIIEGEEKTRGIARSGNISRNTVEDSSLYGLLRDEPKDYGKLVKKPDRRSDNRYKVKNSLKLLKRGKNLRKHKDPDYSFFCGSPTRAYAHIVFSSTTSESLFTYKSLLSICKMQEEKLRGSSNFALLCAQNAQRRCCNSWSLPNYIALLQNRTSCFDIREQDIKDVMNRLIQCASYYHQMKLSHDCAISSNLCLGVPKQCTDYNAVYNIFHYLIDINFLSPDSINKSTHLKYTNVFLPFGQSTALMGFYKDLEHEQLFDGVTQMVAMQLGLKHALFDEYLLHDTIYVGLAGLVVFLVIWMYTTSFFVTFVTFMAVAFSLGIAYFMYTMVYQISFFPFMNILTVIIAIGIGADDAFIYCKIWGCAKAEKNNGTLVKLVRDTLRHACFSMLVTSVTTAMAFFGSFISSITAVRCFSLFAGTAVLVNFLFTVTWLPAALIVAEKWCSSTCCLCIPPFGIYLPQFQRFWCCSPICNFLWKMHYNFTDSARVFFDKILPCIIIKPRYFWIIFLTLVAGGGAFSIFYYPQLSLPESKEFQIFSSDHPFERYDLFLKQQFWFEKATNEDPYHKLPIRVVWGVLPVDTGNYLNPSDRGTLVLDPAFNVAAPESQKWLLSFCKQLRNQSFYQTTSGMSLIPSCFIETFKSWMERKCVDPQNNKDRSPCCENSIFPYEEEVFNCCIQQAVRLIQGRPGLFLIRSEAGPRFSTKDGLIKALVVEYDSVYTYSNSYFKMHEFKVAVENWVKKAMSTAPPGMRNGWVMSQLEFFDLQDSLSDGTLIAIGVAVSVSFLALLITTLNLLISIYAIITIAFIIFVTLGSLVLLGWKLNVLESITVSVAIGLAVDYTIHYGVAYRLSSQEDRESSVIHSLSRIGSPVAMAAFTTFVAGALMFPSVVLAYIQIGTFLMLVTAVSWTYATFFFMSLLSLLGPEKGKLQLNYPSFHCCDTTPVPVDKTVYALSESTLSTSSASYPAQIPLSESHELEPLTVGGIKGNRTDSFRHLKKKSQGSRADRQRSRSFSASLSRTKENLVVGHPGRTPRKVSLPVVSVNVTFHGDPSPRHMSGATSSSTIVCGEEEREILTPPFYKRGGCLGPTPDPVV